MNKYILCVSVSFCLLMSSCLNDEFLEVYPKGQQTEASVFTTYDNFKTYTWGLYNVFFGYTYDTGQTDEIFRGDFESDNMIKDWMDMKVSGHIAKQRLRMNLKIGITIISAVLI